MFSRLMFKNIELWLVGMLVVMAVCGGIVFSWVVTYTDGGGRKLGILGDLAVDIATLPQKLANKELYDPVINLVARGQRFSGEAGFTFNYEAGTRPDLGYLLLNRYDADKQRSVSELVDLNTQKTVHQWTFNVDETWKSIKLESAIRDIVTDEASFRFRNIHSMPLDDGSLLTKSHGSPVIRIDACSNIKPVVYNNLYHHSMEAGLDNLVWTSAHLEPAVYQSNEGLDVRDDAIVAFNTDGEIVFEKSIMQLLLENGLRYLIDSDSYGIANNDRIHMNDVQPVMEDGDIWKKGDVLLSMRHVSIVMLYRPTTNKVIWWHRGDWLRQHDVDIVGDNTISVFDNNVIGHGNGKKVDKTNKIVLYNLKDETVSFAFGKAMEQFDIRTPSEGLAELLPSGELFIEETDYGRLLIVKPDGTATLQYVNRAQEGRIFELNWSRVLSKEKGDLVLKAAKALSCS